MTNPNDPAAPCEPRNQEDMGRSYRGLTKREYFAGLALGINLNLPNATKQELASICVQVADALIAELSKGDK